MIRILAFVLVATGLLNCSRTEDSEGVDVKENFLETMSGTYSSSPTVPNKEGVPADELTITPEGAYTMTQYWHLEYPHETCSLVSDDIDCNIETKTTFCRITDTGKIDRVLKLQHEGAKASLTLQAVTHVIEGMRSSSVLDDAHPYGNPKSKATKDEDPVDDEIDETPTPSSVLACREKVLRKNQSLGSQISRYHINWPDEATLKFQHKTAPEKSGVGSLDVSGTFTKE